MISSKHHHDFFLVWTNKTSRIERHVRQDFHISFCHLLFILKCHNCPHVIGFLQNLILKILFLNSTSYIRLRKVLSVYCLRCIRGDPRKIFYASFIFRGKCETDIFRVTQKVLAQFLKVLDFGYCLETFIRLVLCLSLCSYWDFHIVFFLLLSTRL